MPIKHIRPCDDCGGPISTGSYVVRSSTLIVNPQAVQSNFGMEIFFGGNTQLADVFAPRKDCIIVAGDEDPNLMTEIVLCQQCALMGDVALGELIEKVSQEKDGE